MFHIFASTPCEQLQASSKHQTHVSVSLQTSVRARIVAKKLIRHIPFIRMSSNEFGNENSNEHSSDLFLRVRRRVSSRVADKSSGKMIKDPAQQSSQQGQGLSGSTLINLERGETRSIASQSPESTRIQKAEISDPSNNSPSKYARSRYIISNYRPHSTVLPAPKFGPKSDANALKTNSAEERRHATELSQTSPADCLSSKTISQQNLVSLSSPSQNTFASGAGKCGKPGSEGGVGIAERAVVSQPVAGDVPKVAQTCTSLSQSSFRVNNQSVVSKLGGVTITRSSRSKTVSLIPPPALGSLSRSHSLPRTDRRKKKYPPGSFPEDFYDRFPDPNPSYPYGVINLDMLPCTNPPTSIQSDQALVSEGTNIIDRANLPYREVAEPPDLDESSFYGIIHYFTDCPHMSPPATRPLDTQPYSENISPPQQDAVTRSLIDGACFICDTENRRKEECLVVESYTSQLERLTHKLSNLIAKLEASEIGFEDEDESELTAKMEDEVFNTAVGNAIRFIEEEIMELRETEERDIKRVWQGYSARWGPGTLGVQWTPVRNLDKDGEKNIGNDENSARKDHVLDGSQNPLAHYWDSINLDEGRMKVDWIRPDES